MQVISIRQVDGGTRLLAVSDYDAELVRHDRAMFDYVRSYACCEIDCNGVMTWCFPVLCEDTERGRAAIRAEIEAERQEDDQ